MKKDIMTIINYVFIVLSRTDRHTPIILITIIISEMIIIVSIMGCWLCTLSRDCAPWQPGRSHWQMLLFPPLSPATLSHVIHCRMMMTVWWQHRDKEEVERLASSEKICPVLLSHPLVVGWATFRWSLNNLRIFENYCKGQRGPWFFPDPGPVPSGCCSWWGGCRWWPWGRWRGPWERVAKSHGYMSA